MKDKVKYCDRCSAPVKPKVTFYGESLPFMFYMSFFKIKFADLAFILGTSLQVYPFASLPEKLPGGCWKVLVNREKVGNFDFENQFKKELFLKGNTDEIVERLIKDVGWEREFEAYCKEQFGKLGFY